MSAASARLPAPPGSAIRPSAGGGRGSSAQRRIRSATGAAPLTTWPVISRSPERMALRSRISSGEIPTAAARRSICDSWAKQDWTAPKPRMAPLGTWLVRAAPHHMSTLGTR